MPCNNKSSVIMKHVPSEPCDPRAGGCCGHSMERLLRGGWQTECQVQFSEPSRQRLLSSWGFQSPGESAIKQNTNKKNEYSERKLLSTLRENLGGGSNVDWVVRD